MNTFEIQIDADDKISYRGYYINLNNNECYKDGMDGNMKFKTKLEMFDWINTREALLEVGDLIGSIK